VRIPAQFKTFGLLPPGWLSKLGAATAKQIEAE